MAPTQVKTSPSRKAARSAAHIGSYSPKVDGYIASAAAFAQPILTHIRELVHKALPDVEEEIKWSMPFFIYRGLMLGSMAGFKQHCAFGLWGSGIAERLREDGVYDRNAMGQLGKLTSLKDLPSDRELTRYIRSAAAEIDTGRRTQNYSRPKSTTPQPAGSQFAVMPPGCQREYCEWISEAKRDETRDKRVATAVEWISEGKRRNWKYENC
jgi:uncharacterized protein YdeI (YjbR/CyaY-like superfamily)